MQRIQSYKGREASEFTALRNTSACSMLASRAGSKVGGDIPEHIRVRVLGELLGEEIELVLFHMLSGVHWVLSKTGGGWL